MYMHQSSARLRKMFTSNQIENGHILKASSPKCNDDLGANE